MLSQDRYLSAVTGGAQALAGVAGGDLTPPVPTCPEWTLRQLVTHVGRVHRWAAEIVATRASEPPPFRQVPDGRLPDDPAARPGWLLAGAERLHSVLPAAGDATVWTHLGPGPASFWARRMAHETAVHRADADIALGRRPLIDPGIAADGLDEWFTLACAPDEGDERAGQLAGLMAGRSLHVHLTGPGAAGEWTLRGGDGRITVDRGHAKADAAVRGPAPEVLLVFLRRLPPGGPAVEVFGDRALLDGWLAATAF